MAAQILSSLHATPMGCEQPEHQESGKKVDRKHSVDKLNVPAHKGAGGGTCKTAKQRVGGGGGKKKQAFTSALSPRRPSARPTMQPHNALGDNINLQIPNSNGRYDSAPAEHLSRFIDSVMKVNNKGVIDVMETRLITNLATTMRPTTYGIDVQQSLQRRNSSRAAYVGILPGSKKHINGGFLLMAVRVSDTIRSHIPHYTFTTRIHNPIHL